MPNSRSSRLSSRSILLLYIVNKTRARHPDSADIKHENCEKRPWKNYHSITGIYRITPSLIQLMQNRTPTNIKLKIHFSSLPLETKKNDLIFVS